MRLGAEAFSRKSTGTFDAKVPHPFFFSRPRSISGTQADLDFKEAAFSLTAVLRGGSGKWNLSLEGGPAYFSVEATVAEKLSYSDVYPYDTLAFGGVVSTTKKVNPFGFAVGLEIGRELTSAVSVVAQGRFTQGSGDIDVNGAKINIKAGGAQARIGFSHQFSAREARSVCAEAGAAPIVHCDTMPRPGRDEALPRATAHSRNPNSSPFLH